MRVDNFISSVSSFLVLGLFKEQFLSSVCLLVCLSQDLCVDLLQSSFGSL